MIRILLISCLFLTFIHEKSEASSCKPVVAVYPVWKHNEEVLKTLPWDRFTHLVVFAVYPSEDARLLSADADVFMKKISQIAHAKGKKVIVSIGGAGEASKAFRTIANDSKLRKMFAKNVREYVQSQSLDGVDIDWEYWTYQNEMGKGGNDPLESKNLVYLAAELRKALPEEIMLTADIMAGSWVGEQYLSELQDHVDYVNLMAFDFTGQWNGSAIAHHSDFATFKKAIEYSINQGFKKEKMLVGIPAYGKEFVNGKNKSVKDVSYVDIVETVKGDELLVNKGQYQNTYFETKESVKKKVAYLDESGFPGISLFEVTSDHPKDRYSLLKVASEALNPISCYKDK